MRGVINGILAVCGVVLLTFAASWAYYMPDRDMRGVWMSETGATVLRLSPLTARTYSRTDVSCVADQVFPAHLKLMDLIEGIRVETADRDLFILSDATLAPLRFVKLSNLPPECAQQTQDTTPRGVFDAFWTAMDRHYAFFDLHGVDWNARRALTPDADARMTDADLLALMDEAMAGLDDGHLWVDPGDMDPISPAEPPVWLTDTGIAENVRATLADLAESLAGVALTPVEGVPVSYGLRSDGVAYISIREMDIARPLGVDRGTAMAEALIPVTEALADARAIVIDVRYNPGGSDPIAFGIASHFTNVEIDVLTKAARDGDGETEPHTATLLPYDADPLAQPVIVLAGAMTGSAAEVFVLAMRSLDNVIVMGENTGGSLSDVLDVVLPNGWELGLSNQRFRTMSGVLYEGTGIPPDQEVATDGEALGRGEDIVLEAALARAADL